MNEWVLFHGVVFSVWSGDCGSRGKVSCLVLLLLLLLSVSLRPSLKEMRLSFSISLASACETAIQNLLSLP